MHSQFTLTDRHPARAQSGLGLPPVARGVLPLSFKEHEEVVLATVGALNPNKCVAEVIDAICACPYYASDACYAA